MARNTAIIYLCGLLAETEPILCSISFNFDVTLKDKGWDAVSSRSPPVARREIFYSFPFKFDCSCLIPLKLLNN